MRTYRDLITKYLVPKLGKKKLGALTARDVRQFLAALDRDGVGARTAQYAHAVLRGALEDAMREEVIARNVAKLVRPPRPEREEREPLTVPQVQTLLKATRDHRLHAMLSVRRCWGCVAVRCWGWRWEDVDLDQGVMRIQPQPAPGRRHAGHVPDQE